PRVRSGSSRCSASAIASRMRPMFRSLRARLLMLTVAVAVIALVAAGLVSRVAVRTELHRLQTTANGLDLEHAAAFLSQRFATPEEVPRAGAAADPELARLAGTLGQELVLVAPDGRVLATSDPSLRTARASRHGEVMELETQIRSGEVRTTKRALIRAPAPFVVRARDGGTIGTLYPSPRAMGSGTIERESRFLLAMNRWLLGGVVLAGLLALVLALALSRRILGPVEALTRAARRMEAGDLGQRTVIRSADEIGELSRAFNAMAESLQRQETLRRALVTDVAH